MMSEDIVGFVGLGNMGKPMASRLVAAGFRVIVHDRAQAPVDEVVKLGAKQASSAEEVASEAELVLVSLPTPDIVQDVVFGNNGLLSGGKLRVFVDLSTTGPKAEVSIAERLLEKGVITIDCPVSGGVSSAQKGTLALMASGPSNTFREIEPILAVLGKIFYCGNKAGQGQTLKLANNLMSAAALAVSAEAIAMGVKAGLDPTVMIEVINASSGRNSATQDKFPRAIIPRTFDFGFATGLSYKDARLCVEEAETLGVPMVVGSAVREMLAITQSMYGADSDFTSIARVVETWAGVEIGKLAS
ncbi:oxidoreductase [Burkholderia sp. SG-MS1]|nr:oxidoreductase [Paraburkholderia sp. SG-MS1]